MNDLKLASLARDLPLIEASQATAHAMLDLLAKKSKMTEELRMAVTDEQRILERSVAETNRVFDS